MAHKAGSVSSLAFCRRSLPTPDLEQQSLGPSLEGSDMGPSLEGSDRQSLPKTEKKQPIWQEKCRFGVIGAKKSFFQRVLKTAERDSNFRTKKAAVGFGGLEEADLITQCKEVGAEIRPEGVEEQMGSCKVDSE